MLWLECKEKRGTRHAHAHKSVDVLSRERIKLIIVIIFDKNIEISSIVWINILTSEQFRKQIWVRHESLLEIEFLTFYFHFFISVLFAI